jgi:hypothetical protein
MFIYLLRFVLIASFILLVVSQIMVPALFGRPIFPVFRNRKKKMDLKVAKTMVEEAEIEREIREELKKGEKINRR